VAVNLGIPLRLPLCDTKVVPVPIPECGLKLFLFAEGLPLPLTTPARRHVQFLAELSLVQIPSQAFLLSLSGRSPEYRYVDEFALSMRLREVVSAFDDGTRGRGVACARLGLEYF
jgi:hypothetical protein